jgi:hypothetical protein
MQSSPQRIGSRTPIFRVEGMIYGTAAGDRSSANACMETLVLQEIVRRIPVSAYAMKHTPATLLIIAGIMSNAYSPAAAIRAGE